MRTRSLRGFVLALFVALVLAAPGGGVASWSGAGSVAPASACDDSACHY